MEHNNPPSVDLPNQTPITETPKPQRIFKAMKFHGDGKEFFSIWIVNLLLSIVTLGIYSAWAKVRTNRYFYANLEADGHRLSYLAEPMQILKGRILAVLLFGGYALSLQFFPLVGIGLMIFIMLLSPWLICQSLRFNLKMTSYRNVRFGFNGKYGEAFLVFFVWPILSLFTLYLAMPFAVKEMNRFMYANMTYGDKPFSTELSGGHYWVTSFVTSLLVIGLMMGMMIVLSLVGVVSFGALGEGSEPGMGTLVLMQVVMMGSYILAFIIGGSYYTTQIRNHIFDNTEIIGVAKFSSKVDFGALVTLRVTNLLMLVCTVGMAYAWVKVRTAHFFADSTELMVSEEAERVLATASDNSNALGEEASEVFDFDIALV